MGDPVPALLAALLIAILLAAARLAIEGLVRRWKASFGRTMGPAGAQIRGGQASLADAAREAATYAPADPAPYGPLAADLHRAVAGAGEVHQHITRRRTQLLRAVPARPAGRLASLWFMLVLEPYYWWRISRHMRAWDAGLALQSPEIDGLLARLRALPLETAKRCMAARHLAQQAGQMARALQSAGLRGLPLDMAAETVRQLEVDLEELPDCFLQGADRSVLDRATKESTIAAWQSVEQIETQLQQQIDQLGQWQAAQDAIRRKLPAVQKETALAVQIAGQVRAEIDAARLLDELVAVQAEVQALADRCAAPYVDDLSGLGEQLSRAGERATRLVDRLSGIRPQLDRLRSILPAAAVLLDDIEIAMENLAHEPAWPIAWGAHEQGLAWLRLVQTRIGPAGDLRTLERLGEHLRLAERLTAEARALQTEVDRARAQREALIGLSGSPALASGTAWLDECRAAARQAAAYWPGNWPPEDAVSQLQEDGEALWHRLQAAAPNAGEPLPAAGLERRIEELRQVLGEIEPFQERLTAIAARLAAIQAAEQSARRDLQPLCQSIGHLVDALRRDSLSSELARQERLLSDLEHKGQTLLADLDRRDSGQVDDKARRAARWASAARRALPAAVQDLRAEAGRTQAGLAQKLQAVRQIAPLDGEGIVQEAAQFRPAATPPRRKGDPLALAREAEALLQELRQAARLRHTIQAQVETPLQSPLAALEKSRNLAEDHYARLIKLKQAAERAWPPIRCEADRVGRRLRAAREEENQLQASGQTVSQVLRQVARIATQYEDAVAEAEDAQDRIKRDQRELETLAARLAAWQAQLAAYRAAHAQDAAASTALGQRMAQIDQEVSRMRQRWQGRPPYAQDARDALHRLWEAAREDLWLEGSSRPLRARDIESGTR